MSRTFSIQTFQRIPVSIETAWEFFSNPANLQEITPPHLGFQIISKYHGDQMYPGQIIEYKVRPLFHIPLYWMTEITHVETGRFFVDEQRFGPYRMWHHQHHFKAIEGGVEMTDIVHYKLPLGFLGNWAHALFVQQQLRSIFNYRFECVEKRFGSLK